MNLVTTALRKITGLILRGRKEGKRIFIVRGGQGAGKTISFLLLIINNASSNEDREWIILSEELTKMRDSVIKDFLKIVKTVGVWHVSRWNKSDLSFSFPNGSQIKFRSTDKDDAGKGVRVYGVYFNEINKITFEAYNQYASRAELVLADYNPDAPFFVDDEVIPREDCSFMQLTYKDNEELNKVEREEILGYYKRGYNKDGTIKDPYWANKWKVYGLGDVGSLIGSVFNNWEIIDDIPKEARLRSGGLDFGYTNDPTAIVSVYEWGGFIVLDEQAYETELNNEAIKNKIRTSSLKDATVYCDSAEPKSIADLRRMGVKAVGVDKGSDSVRFGIDLMQRRKYKVTQRSKNIISNFRNYIWEVDRNGKSTNKPVDKNNHAIDAIRYEEMGKGKFTGNYVIR